MVRHDVLTFLRDPRAFATGARDHDRWLAGLEQFAQPVIAEKGDLDLRPAQVEAWRGIASERAALLLGPPGTGKTFALSWMALGYLEACRAAEVPCRILVTGFTRNAIANLLEAVQEKAARYTTTPPQVAYLGESAPDGLDSAIDRVSGKEAPQLLEAPYVVVGATTWSLFKLLNKGGFPGSDGPTARLFDLVCIDEASQMVVSQGLMAMAGLAEGGRVLVAGDNKQLPPVRAVHDREVEGKRLGASLYDFLYHAGVSEFGLDETFRLNEPLTAFPSERFYEGRFRSVGDARTRRLKLRDGWEQGLESWERLALDPEHPVCILLHDGPPAGTHNPFEVGLTTLLARLLHERMAIVGQTDEERQRDFWHERLAIVSPHRAQNAAIRQVLKPLGIGESAVVETVDRIQGRERDAIIASYTVADTEFALAEAAFIYSQQRFNVTVTRSRTKLILLVSRRLFETIPSDEGVFEAAQALREFVFTSTDAGTVSLSGPEGRSYRASVRLRRFDDQAPLPDVTPTEPPPAIEPAPDMTRADWELLGVIQRLALASDYGTAASYQVSKEVHYPVGLPELQTLLLNGHIALAERRATKTGNLFWAIRPLDPPRPPYPVDADTVRARIDEVIEGARRGRGAPRYAAVRDRFAWITLEGGDRLRPIVQELVDEGRLAWGTSGTQQTIDLAEPAIETELAPEPAEKLEDGDFEVLNRLEDMEARRINFGVFERWSTLKEVARAIGRPREEIAASARRLQAHGHLWLGEEGRVRSRMAELARELRYVKQRFGQGDAHRRPYLVRALKLAVKNRDKPVRTEPLADIERSLAERLVSIPEAETVLAGIGGMLRRAWKAEKPLLAGFQRRSLERILPALLGLTEEDAFVITADTGSGKTEAACLPLIAGAAIDRLRGIAGTRAVLVYPRVQLGANQAQRLASYLAALEHETGMPLVTLGLQNGQVPESFNAPPPEGSTWERTPSGAWTFPFFACPTCTEPLRLSPGAGREGADRLDCSACPWHFTGWVGSKSGLRQTPPALFLPVTESLHQWLQNPDYAPLFGHGPCQPPRAVLADEIHLYAQIHGAQVGYTLRRLIARAQADDRPAPLAIGMSATLGRPGEVWGSLVGREAALLIRPEAEERVENPRAREYFYFVQPEVESRGSDVAGASTTIQSVMCLAHGMRRRTGKHGGFRSLVFLDSIDKVKRLHSDYMDAEEGKRLAQYRTRMYNDDPLTGQPCRQCCGKPELCDTFRDGECWYFAANDPAQTTARGRYQAGRGLRVATRPVFSGTGGSVETMIRASDVVFSTSSLEVGYDDPDMTLVYQHYAPVNLASFVQRKGRGGRGADDRPITGVTLSVYSPRDAWYFRRPEHMLDAAHFEVPLNMDNEFVRRGQAVALILDLAARHQAGQGGLAWPVPESVLAEATAILPQVCGATIFQALGVVDARELWRQASAPHHITLAAEPLKRWFKALPWVPNWLFDTINLPSLAVAFKNDQGQEAARDEDIALAFGGCAPGNMTRRYGFGLVHWMPPQEGRAPLLEADAYGAAARFSLPGGSAALLAGLPLEARLELGTVIAPEVIRPTRLPLRQGGRVDGAAWVPFWGYDEAKKQVSPLQADQVLPTIGAKSRGFMRGFLLVQSEGGTKHPLEALRPLAENVVAFVGLPGQTGGTGLRALRVFWGADADLVLDDQGKRKSAAMRQTFIAPHDAGQAVLHGYGLETEGIQLHVDPKSLTRFVAQERGGLSPVDKRYLQTQFLRYVVESRLAAEGMNVFQARQLAELLATAVAYGDTDKAIRRLLRRWNPASFMALLCETYAQALSHHPVLTARRIEALGEALPPEFDGTLREMLDEAGSEAAFDAYVASLVLHGLAIRLHQRFVLHGRGDERRVLFHARLPIQFGADADTVLTVLENGEHGDGTTRTFLRDLEAALAGWSAGLGECPNAEEDALLERLITHPDLEAWKALNPLEPGTVETLAAALGADPSTGALQGAMRLLYGVEELAGERFSLLALHLGVRSVRHDLLQAFGREPSVWELVSAVVRRVEESPDALPEWATLHEVYGALEDASLEGSLAPSERLADQVYRLSGRLCVDGCQACLHTNSTLMRDSLVETAVSRRVLERFAAFIFSSGLSPAER